MAPETGFFVGWVAALPDAVGWLVGPELVLALGWLVGPVVGLVVDPLAVGLVVGEAELVGVADDELVGWLVWLL